MESSRSTCLISLKGFIEPTGRGREIPVVAALGSPSSRKLQKPTADRFLRQVKSRRVRSLPCVCQPLSIRQFPHSLQLLVLPVCHYLRYQFESLDAISTSESRIHDNRGG